MTRVERVFTDPTVYGVVHLKGETGSLCAVFTDPDDAKTYARGFGGVVVAWPILADFRRPITQEA